LAEAKFEEVSSTSFSLRLTSFTKPRKLYAIIVP
jgi:hypothetical protein